MDEASGGSPPRTAGQMDMVRIHETTGRLACFPFVTPADPSSTVSIGLYGFYQLCYVSISALLIFLELTP